MSRKRLRLLRREARKKSPDHRACRSYEQSGTHFLGIRRTGGSYNQLFRWDTLEDV